MSYVSEHGNTVAHSAAAGGKGECFNCAVRHNANLTITNAVEETPLETAKKAGHPILMDKAGWSISDTSHVGQVLHPAWY